MKLLTFAPALIASLALSSTRVSLARGADDKESKQEEEKAETKVQEAGDAQPEADEGDDWVQSYYKNPRPEEFEAEIKRMQTSGALKQEMAMLAGVAAFSSRLFAAAKPEQLAKWLETIDKIPEEERAIFHVALHWAATEETKAALKKRAEGESELAEWTGRLLKAKAPALDKISNPGPSELDMCWGAFFATGEPVYVLTIIRCAAQPEKEKTVDLSRGAAQWSLKGLSKGHKKVIEIKDEFLKTASDEEKAELEKLFKE